VKQVISKFSLPVFSNKPDASCASCQQAKAHQLPFPASTSVFNRPLQLLFSDVWGPSPVISYNGNKYYVTFVDAFSRFTWLFPIQCKSDVFSVFNKFLLMVERLFNTKILQVQTDWGGEFRSLNTFFHKLGIIHRVSCPHTHQQQGCVERKHCHIIDTTLALLAESHVPKRFWDEACQTLCYLINRLPTPTLQHKSPFQKLFNRSPDYKFLRIFGCVCFPNLRPYNQHKFEFRSQECVFLGYSRNHKGYKCFHIPTGRMYISRDVVFHESTFPFSSYSSAPQTALQPPSTVLPSFLPIPSHSVRSPPMASETVSPSPSPLSASGSTSSFTESPNTSPSPLSLSPNPCPAPTRIHPMVTRA
jgi:hypothetical protein